MIVTAAGNYPRISDEPGGQALRRAIAQLDEGRIDWAGVRQVQDKVVKTVIQEQVEAGLDLVTDGLIRWDDAVTYIVRGLGGFTTEGLARYLDTNTFFREPIAQARVQWRGPITVADWRYATAISPKPVKAVLTGPYTLGRLSRSSAHGNRDDLVLEIGRALSQEVRALHEAGAQLVQIDEPVITRSPEDWPIFREAMTELTHDITGRVALNANFGSVAKLRDLFGLPFHVFGLDLIQGPENWDLLDRVPAHRDVVLGIVDAREVRLEEPGAIATALERAARFVSPDRMHLSPNCGLEFLPRETARAKLRQMVEGARLFSGVPSR